MSNISGLLLLADTALRSSASSPSISSDESTVSSPISAETSSSSSPHALSKKKKEKEIGKHDTLKSYKLCLSLFVAEAGGLDETHLKKIDRALAPTTVLATKAVPQKILDLAPGKEKQFRELFAQAANDHRQLANQFNLNDHQRDPIISLILEKGNPSYRLSKAAASLFVQNIELIRGKLTNDKWAVLIEKFGFIKNNNYQQRRKNNKIAPLTAEDFVKKAIEGFANKSDHSFDEIFATHKKEITAAIAVSFLQNVSAFRGKSTSSTLLPSVVSSAGPTFLSTSSSALSAPYSIDSSSNSVQKKFIQDASQFLSQLPTPKANALVSQLTALWESVHDSKTSPEEIPVKLARILESIIPDDSDISEGIYPLAHDYLSAALPEDDSDDDVDVEVSNVSCKRKANEITDSEIDTSSESHKKQKTANSANSEPMAIETS